jgi:hypothetical protein
VSGRYDSGDKVGAMRAYCPSSSVGMWFCNSWSLSELASYFAASNALSMLVRYYPSRWASMANHEKGDKVLPVLDRMRSLVQTEFIRLALWQVE